MFWPVRKMASTNDDQAFHGVESSRLSLIRNAVKDVYKVNIIESSCFTCNNNRTQSGNNQTCRCKCVNVQDQILPGSSAKKSPSSKLSKFPKSEILCLTLRFEGDVTAEEIWKAKNFARTHLQPGPDYITSPHPLENQDEFNMVLENSQDIQATTTSLLTFDPECLEVTLEGPSSTVALGRSKVVGILEKYREHSRIDSNLGGVIDYPVEGNRFYHNLFLDNFIEKQFNDSSELSNVLSNGPDSKEISKPNQFKQKDNCVISSDVTGRKNGQDLQSKIKPNWQQAEPEIDNDDIECDNATSPVTSAPQKLAVLPAQHLHNEDSLRKASLSSSDDENSYEENILTDPRYSKKIEQALKLGYSEKQVMKALVKHGPECDLNDLLSELIKLGASDPVPSVTHSLSPESDAIFLNDTMDFMLGGCRKSNVISLESADSSGFSSSADSHGSSLVDNTDANNLRDIIIDGSNVAMSHGKKFYSCKGIQIAVNWFKERGHKTITAFVPQWRKETSRSDTPITDQEILYDLEKEGIVVFTPARRVKGRRVVCYDDRYVLKLAVETDGIVVSNDVYRDLVNEREDFRKVVDQRLLMYSFVNDRFMPPEDPLGRLGPTLDNFLRKVPAELTPKPQDCPYGKKCTYGNKCRFYHPERGFAPQKLITETLKEQADLKLQERATRLSEIAEKGKRSKQKLSRTKSLVPWEPLVPSIPSQVAGVSLKNKQDKPKLAHSKSLVLPSKSSDYLNEPRKRLEEAELTTAMEKMSALETSFVQQVSAQGILPDDPDSTPKVKQPSQRSSPVQKDAQKQAVASSPDTLKNSFPAKSVNSNSPRASPAHLTVPKQEPPERYLSGHLYLAKKLSDESMESNFFSEHTSSPSSTRTSSPVVPLSKIPEQFPGPETRSKTRQMDISGSFTCPPPFHPSLVHQQQAPCGPQTGLHDLENIPNLSIFESGMSHYSQRSENFHTSPTYKQENVDSPLIGDYMHQIINPLSPDSGSYTSADLMQSPYQNPMLIPQSHPWFIAEQPHQSTEKLNLRRAISSTGNFKTSEDLHQKVGRRASAFSSSHGTEDHYQTQLHVSSLEKSSAYQFGHSSGLNRQNSSSDPQMLTAGTGELQNMLPPVFGCGHSAQNLQAQYSPAIQHCQSQNKHFENQQFNRSQLLQHQQQQNRSQQLHQQQDPSGLRSSLSYWAEPVGQSNVSQRSSVVRATQNQYNPLECQQLAQTTNHTSHFPSTTAGPTRIISSSYSPTSYPVQPQYNHQYPLMYQPHLDQSSSNMFSQVRRQSAPTHYNYHQLHNVATNPVRGFSEHHQTIPKVQQQPSMPFILPEEAPIATDDPRYSIYYHLSNVFGEPIVRKVMNRFPNERDPHNVCNLILQCKEEMEL